MLVFKTLKGNPVTLSNETLMAGKSIATRFVTIINTCSFSALPSLTMKGATTRVSGFTFWANKRFRATITQYLFEGWTCLRADPSATMFSTKGCDTNSADDGSSNLVLATIIPLTCSRVFELTCSCVCSVSTLKTTSLLGMTDTEQSTIRS